MSNPTLKRGSAGDSVKHLQDRLRVHLGAPEVSDGIFGWQSQLAVEVFQRQSGLDADGIVGPKTWEALERDATQKADALTVPISSKKLRIFLDPGHGQGNRKAGTYDGGAESDGVKEAVVVLAWAKVLAPLLAERGHEVAFSRFDQTTPTSISSRTARAQAAFEGKGAHLLLSLHCNAANGSASGTETFYRHATSRAFAQRVNDALTAALVTKDRGVKSEKDSQHPGGIHVLSYKPDSILVELGFIDNDGDRAKLTDPETVKRGCEAIANAI